MKTNLAIMAAAVQLAASVVPHTGADGVVTQEMITAAELKAKTDEATKKLDAAKKAFAESKDATQNILLLDAEKEAADVVAISALAQKLYAKEAAKAESEVMMIRADLRNRGYQTHNPAPCTGSIADAYGSNAKSWLSRVF